MSSCFCTVRPNYTAIRDHAILYVAREDVHGARVRHTNLHLPRAVQRQWSRTMKVDGMEYLHEHDVTHRDLKPENLLLQSSEDGWRLKIIDFGLSNTHEVSTPCPSSGTNLARGAFDAAPSIKPHVRRTLLKTSKCYVFRVFLAGLDFCVASGHKTFAHSCTFTATRHNAFVLHVGLLNCRMLFGLLLARCFSPHPRKHRIWLFFVPRLTNRAERCCKPLADRLATRRRR